MKKKIIILILTIVVFLSGFSTYAWYIDKSNMGYITSSNIDLDITGYYSYTDTNNNIKQEWTNLSETKTSIQIEFDYSLNFGFVVTNNSDKDIDLSLKFSDFSSCIFNSFKGNASITSDEKEKQNIIKEIEKYNSKFFLYIDSFKMLEDSDLTKDYKPNTYDSSSDKLNDVKLNIDDHYTCLDDTCFLWQFSYNNVINKEKINIEKGKTKVIYLTFKTSQSQVSLKEDYTNWLYTYGVSYIKNNTEYSSSKENVIKSYLRAYYNLERESLYEDKDGASVLRPTKLCIDHFEFISDF